METRMGMVFDKVRYHNFLTAAEGLSARQTGKVMTRYGTSGVNWVGVGKREMAEAYSYGVGFERQISEGVISKLYAEPRRMPHRITCDGSGVRKPLSGAEARRRETRCTHCDRFLKVRPVLVDSWPVATLPRHKEE